MTSDLRISSLATTLVLGLTTVAGLVAGVLANESPWAVAFGVLTASVAIGVVPGALCMLAWRARPEFTILELLGAGIAASFGMVQLLTMLALTLHLSADEALTILGVVTIGHGIMAARNAGTVIRLPPHQIGLGIAVAAIAGCLYVIGARFDSTEDAIHVAIARRLMSLANPSLDNIYFFPGRVYTYPFPGIHYFIALVSRASDIDPLFVYHKLRAFWGSAAVVLLYACARRLFQNERLALSAALVATALSANGSFGAVDGYYWGQLAPFSHASDVAMGVLLPALLLSALWTLQAATRRERVVAMSTCAGMLVMLVIVHIREVAQFTVYLLAFAIALIVTRRDRVTLGRTLALLAVTIVGMFAYTSWSALLATDLAGLVASRRASLVDVMKLMSASNAVTPGVDLMPGYMPGYEVFFYGWNPIVLLCGGVALWKLRASTGALLIGASVLSYAAIVRFAPLTAAYVYVTYFEILFTPVRNVVFFVHLLAGVTVYVAATAIAARRRSVALLLSAITGVAITAAYRALGPAMTTHNDLLWLPLLGIYGGAAALIVRHPPPLALTTRDTPSPSGTLLVALALVAPMLWVSWNSEASPLAAVRQGTIATPSALLSERSCHEVRDYEPPDTATGAVPIRIDSVLSCRPSAGLAAFANSTLPVGAVLAVDRFDDFSPSMYVPQQMDVWPGRGDGLLDKRALFAAYYRYYDATIAKYGDQPFFNLRETPDERIAFLNGLGITHVLVNPRNHASLVPLLTADSRRFQERYDDGEWAVYEVTR